MIFYLLQQGNYCKHGCPYGNENKNNSAFNKMSLKMKNSITFMLALRGLFYISGFKAKIFFVMFNQFLIVSKLCEVSNFQGAGRSCCLKK